MTTPLDVQAVPTHLASVSPEVAESMAGASSRRRKCKYHLIPRTVLLTSDTPADQLLRPDPNREYAIIIARGNDIVLTERKGDAQTAAGQPVTSYQSVTAGGTAVAPVAPGTVIASLVAPTGGLYSISVNTYVGGVVAADRNNMQLNWPGGSAVLPVASSGQGTEQSQPVMVSLAAGGIVTVTQIGATTATGYYAVITATPSPGPALLGLTGGSIPHDQEIRLPAITSELWAAAVAYPTPVTVLACYREE